MRIRAARADDERAVRAVCARIWGEYDYIPDVFREWVKDHRGRLWVAVEDGRVAAVAKLTLLGQNEAWLHALRVDPAYQRRGFARALVAHRLERARRLGARVARLGTHDDNTAVLRLMRHFGFRQVSRLSHYESRATGGARPRRATLAELPALWRLARTGDGLVHESYVVRRVTRRDLARAVRDGTAFVAGLPGAPGALAIVEPITRASRAAHGHGSRLRLRYLAGAPAPMRDLLRALRAEAGAARLSRAGFVAPSTIWATARRAGYRRRWRETMLIFERRLSASGTRARSTATRHTPR